MAYSITVIKRHHEVEEGTKSTHKDYEDRSFYCFETDTDKNDYVCFSWDYIAENKQYFDVSIST